MKIQKRIVSLLLTSVLVLSNVGTTLAAPMAQPSVRQGQSQTQGADQRKDVLVACYREYNGYLQRRYWNETQGYWEGQWETIGVATRTDIIME